jgi:hypothetical protein
MAQLLEDNTGGAGGGAGAGAGALRCGGTGWETGCIGTD